MEYSINNARIVGNSYYLAPNFKKIINQFWIWQVLKCEYKNSEHFRKTQCLQEPWKRRIFS
jgi:hypothetical protein